MNTNNLFVDTVDVLDTDITGFFNGRHFINRCIFLQNCKKKSIFYTQIIPVPQPELLFLNFSIVDGFKLLAAFPETHVQPFIPSLQLRLLPPVIFKHSGISFRLRIPNLHSDDVVHC